MSLFKHIRTRREADRAAIENSQALLAAVETSEDDVQSQRQWALTKLREAEEQARRLKAADHRNHYSESLTHAFRGNPA